MEQESPAASAAPVKRGRGRPPGSRNKNPKKGQVTIEQLGANIAEDDETGSTMDTGEKKMSKREAVELMFAELNQGVSRVRVRQASNGLPTIVNEEVLPPNFLETAFEGVHANPEGFCSPSEKHMWTMASVSMNWRTLPAHWVNCSLPFARNTGPCLTLCRRNHTPNPPDDFRELAYLVAAVNTLPNYDGCIVPTPETRLKWNADYTHIIGMQHVEAGVEERERQNEELSRRGVRKKIYMGMELPQPDEISYSESGSSTQEVFVTCDVATLVLSILPVIYELGGREYKETFWIATVLPQPGVDIVRCMERIGKPHLVHIPRDVKTAQVMRPRMGCSQ